MGRDPGRLRQEVIGPRIAEIGPTSDSLQQEYKAWISAGMNAGMEYLARNEKIRNNPAELLEGAKSILVYAFPYHRHPGREAGLPMISRYAFGEDYHDAIRAFLKSEGERIREALRECGKECAYRACVDTAPLSERYWAVRSGLCFRGLNGTAIIRGVGSFFFLGELIVTAKRSELEEAGICFPNEGAATEATECKRCGACLRACPTGALAGDGTIDCRSCLSYLTIEHRGEWDERGRLAMRTDAGRATLYGCDRCLEACPHNRGEERGAVLPEFAPDRRLLTLTAAQAAALSQPEFSTLLRGKAMKRAKREGLLRNALNCLFKEEERREKERGGERSIE